MIDCLRRLHGHLYEKRKRKALLKDPQKSFRDIKASSKYADVSIMTIDETLDALYEGKSMCRFGDGELDLILGREEGYQRYNEALAKRLREILESKPDKCIVCIPDALETIDNLTDDSLSFWIPYMERQREKWLQILNKNQDLQYRYGTTNVSRCYMRYKDKSKCEDWFKRIRSIWNDREIYIVEGVKTRLGCGNDFFDNAKTVKRILGPAENAFDKLDIIKQSIISIVPRGGILVMALGPCATILAYELAEMGYQALDVGHIDLEYSWFLNNETKKVAVAGKYTNEVQNGNVVSDEIVDQKYLDEIIERIG